MPGWRSLACCLSTIAPLFRNARFPGTIRLKPGSRSDLGVRRHRAPCGGSLQLHARPGSYPLRLGTRNVCRQLSRRAAGPRGGGAGDVRSSHARLSATETPWPGDLQTHKAEVWLGACVFELCFLHRISQPQVRRLTSDPRIRSCLHGTTYPFTKTGRSCEWSAPTGLSGGRSPIYRQRVGGPE